MSSISTASISALERFIATATEQGNAHPLQLEYARAKITTCKYRLKGDISAAVNVERRCDDYYARLPKKYRW